MECWRGLGDFAWRGLELFQVRGGENQEEETDYLHRNGMGTNFFLFSLFKNFGYVFFHCFWLGNLGLEWCL